MRLKFILEGVIAGICFGSASIIIRFLGDVNPYMIAFSRVFLGALILILFSNLLRRKTVLIADKSIASMGALLGIHFIFFISAVQHTTVMNATVLVNTAPILALVTGFLVFGLSFDRRDLIFIFTGFLGSALIVGFELDSSKLTGDLEAIVAALLLALYLNLGFKSRLQGEVIETMASVYLIASISILVTLIPQTHLISIPFNLKTLFMLFLIALIPTAIGHTLLYSSLKGLKSYEAATIALIEPISASILALILFCEVPSINAVFGSALILFSIFWIALKK